MKNSNKNIFIAVSINLIFLSIILACGGGGGGGGDSSSTWSAASGTTAPQVEAIPLQHLIDNHVYQYRIVVSEPGEAISSGYTFEIITAPEGLTVDNTGLVSWTPMQSQMGNFTAEIKVSNRIGQIQTVTIRFNVIHATANTPPSIETIPAQSVDEGVIFTYQVKASDLHTPITYSVESGPDGMTIDSTGLITWAPGLSQTGQNHVAVITTADRYGLPSSVSISITVGSAGPVITPIPALSGSIGVPLTYDRVQSFVRNTPVTYALINNPSGMTIDSNGVITWTPTSVYCGKSMTVTVKATDAKGLVGTADFTLSVFNVSPAVEDIPDQIGTSGEIFSYQVVATDTNTPLTYSISYGPSDMVIGSNGKITWTFGAMGAYSIGVKVTDSLGQYSEKAFAISVTNIAPELDPIPDQTANVGILSEIPVTATDPNTPFTYILSNAPSGMQITAAGLIQWTPTSLNEGITYNNVQVTVTDYYGLSTSTNFNITVNNTPPAIPAIPNRTLNVSNVFSQSVTATDMQPPLTYELASGNPASMSIDGNGLISWTVPVLDEGHIFNITVRVTDSHPTDQLYSEQIFTITVNSTPPVIAAIPNQTAIQGKSFRFDISPYVSDANLPLTYSLTAIPSTTPDMTIDANGVITSTPASSGAAETVTLKVTDSLGAFTSRSFDLEVDSSLCITTTALPGIAKNASYFARLSGLGGTLPYSWAVSAGSLPSGLILDANSGIIYGTPTSSGDSTFTIELTDSTVGPIIRTKDFTISISALNIVDGANLPNATVGIPFALKLSSFGGTSPYTYSLQSGDLPTGILLDSNGIISGTPTASGNYSFEIKTVDSVAASGKKILHMTVDAEGTAIFNCTRVYDKTDAVSNIISLNRNTSQTEDGVILGKYNALNGTFFSRRVPITLTGSASALTDFQVKVEVPYDSDMKGGYADIRFYSEKTDQLLPHWLEKRVSTGANIAPSVVTTGAWSTCRNTSTENWDKLIDGTAAFWCSTTIASPQWVYLEFPSRTISHVHVYNHTNPPYTPRDYVIETWNGSTWDIRGTEVGNACFHRDYFFDPVTTTRVRFYATSVNGGSGYYPVVNEIEIYEAASEKAVYWVKMPYIPTAGEQFYVYYGNGTASSVSSGTDTFEFFDDFSGNLSKWQTVNGGSFSIANGYLRFYNASVDNNYLLALKSIGTSGFIIESKMASNFSSGNGHGGFMWHANTSTGSSHRNDHVYIRAQAAGASNIQPAYFNGSLMTFGVTTGNYTYATWYEIKVVLQADNSVKYYRDGINEANWGSQQYQSNTYTGIVAHNSNETFWDNYRVRKYAAVEPAASLGGEEALAAINVQASGSLATYEISPSVISSWDKVEFSDLKASNGGPDGTDVKYQVEYWDGATWALVPDIDIADNSIGNSDSPISLAALNPVTYSRIRVVANLSTADISTTPKVYNIKVTWNP